MLQIRLVFIIVVLVSLGISQGRMNGIGVGHFNKYQGIQNAVMGLLNLLRHSKKMSHSQIHQHGII